MRHPPITPAGLCGILLYLTQRKEYREDIFQTAIINCPELLLQGLPQGWLKDAKLHTDNQRQGIAVTVRKAQARGTPKGEEPQLATPRILDPEMVLVCRLLTLAGNTIFLDTDGKASPHHHLQYGGMGKGIDLLRLIANAQPGEKVNEAVHDHHDLRRVGLSKAPVTGGSHRGQLEAIAIAMETFKKNRESLRFAMSAEQYLWLLREAFSLLDDVPAGWDAPAVQDTLRCVGSA